MYSNNRQSYRETFIITWQKHKKNLSLSLFELEIIQVVLAHPDYQIFLEKTQHFQNQEFTFEENPFLHMGLHLTLRDQIKTNRPSGITRIFKELSSKQDEFINLHEIEHHMMNCLAKILWVAQQNGIMPDENEYLIKLKQLCDTDIK